MGFWKEVLSDPPTVNNNYYVSEGAARERRKEAEAEYLRTKAEAEASTAKAKAEADVTMLKMNQVTNKAVELKELASTGTFEAYRTLFETYFTEKKNYKVSGWNGKKTSIDNFDDVKDLLKSFPYTKVPGEIEKIYRFLVYKLKEDKGFEGVLAEEQLENMALVAEVYSSNEEVAQIIPQIKETLGGKKAADKKDEKNAWKILIAIVVGIILLLLIFGS